MRYPYIPIRMAKIQNPDNTKYWWGCKAAKLSSVADGNAQRYSHFGRQLVRPLGSWTYSYHIMQQSHSLLSTQGRWKLMSIQKPAHEHLQRLYQYFLILGNQPRCVSTSESINNLWFIHMLLSRFSHVRLCVTPEMAAHQAPPSLGFSRQEHWSGLPFPSPMHESEK